MIRYILTTIQNRLSRGRALFFLTVFGVALGVASVISIQILNRASLSAFAGSVQAISGDADFSLVSKLPTLDESIYPQVLADHGVESAWPLYRIDVTLRGEPEFFLELWGTDFFAPVRMPIETLGGADDTQDGAGIGSAVPLSDVLTVPGWVAVTPSLAEERGWSIGDRIDVTSGSRTSALTIGALVDFEKFTPLAPRKLAVMDISQLQARLGRAGEIHQIDVRVTDRADPEETMRRLVAELGPNIEALTGEQQEAKAAGLLEAFRLNLTALSLISVFVGIFLVYTAVQASLVRRRSEFGTLRSLGATRGQVFTIILIEVAVLGVLGVALGIPMGYFAALQNVEVVSATLTNLYLLEEIETVELPWTLYAIATLVGLGGAVGGAILPTLDMTRRDTKSLLVAFTLHERAARFAPRLFLAAVILLAGGVAWYLWLGHAIRSGGFVLGLVLLISIPLLTPWWVQEATRRVRVSGFGIGLSIRSLGLRLQTTSVSVAALAIAVSMLVGVTLLIGSFRKTLDTWIESSIRADIYITSESWARAGSAATLDDEILTALSTHPGVDSVERLRQIDARTGDRSIRLAGLAMTLADSSYHLPVYQGDSDEILDLVRRHEHVAISEPLARKEGLGLGDSLVLATPGGEVAFPIAGVTYDYSTEGGSAVLDLETMNKYFGDAPINNVALYLADEVDPERAVDQLKAKFQDVPLNIRSNRQLRTEIFEVFDQTFAITRILQGMALLVAVVGIALTLLVLAQERIAELALYRALGALRRQIFRLYIGEGLGLGLLGLAVGLIGGLLLALILIYVINRAYFGWTIRAAWSWGAIAQQMGVILIAAAAASLYPALRASRTPAAELTREDL